MATLAAATTTTTGEETPGHSDDERDSEESFHANPPPLTTTPAGCTALSELAENPQEVAVLQVSAGFQFLEGVQFSQDDQLTQALLNMSHNAVVLKEVVAKYLHRYRLAKNIPIFVKGVRFLGPIVKIAIVYAVGTSATNALQHAANEISGNIEELCDTVVKRSCADVLMALHVLGTDNTVAETEERSIKHSAMLAFLQLHNALEVMTYVTEEEEQQGSSHSSGSNNKRNASYLAKNQSLREFISDKLRKPLSSLASHFVQVLDTFEIEEIKRMEREHGHVLAKVLSKLTDGGAAAAY
jgi:hypothetical protein